MVRKMRRGWRRATRWMGSLSRAKRRQTSVAMHPRAMAAWVKWSAVGLGREGCEDEQGAEEAEPLVAVPLGEEPVVAGELGGEE
jgi:hypothetical protein